MYRHLYALFNHLKSCKKLQHDCVRFLTALLLVFQVIAFGTLWIHIEEVEHAPSPITGHLVHISGEHQHIADEIMCVVRPMNDVTDEEDCLALDYALASSLPISTRVEYNFYFENQPVSSEIIFRHLQSVYLSHLALRQAPKHSPPSVG